MKFPKMREALRRFYENSPELFTEILEIMFEIAEEVIAKEVTAENSYLLPISSREVDVMLCLDEDLLTRYAGYEKTSQLFAALSDNLSSVLQAHYTGIQSWVVMNFPETGDLVDYVWDYRVSEYADKTCPFIKLEYDLGSLVVYPVFREFGLEDLLIKDEREGFYMGDFDDMGAEI